MLQRHRVVLEGRMQVGLRGMAGVACLGEQRQVGQAEPGRQRAALGDLLGAAIAQQGGVGGAVVSFVARGGREAAFAVIDATRVCSITTNLGDTKTTISHPASTSHGRLTEQQRQAAGIVQGMVRLAVGLEDLEDLKADLSRGLAGLTR